MVLNPNKIIPIVLGWKLVCAMAVLFLMAFFNIISPNLLPQLEQGSLVWAPVVKLALGNVFIPELGVYTPESRPHAPHFSIELCIAADIESRLSFAFS